MKTLLIALAMGTAFVTGASAADIGGGKHTAPQSMLDSVETPVARSWTGPWIGASVGYTVGTLRPDGYDFGISAEGLTAKVDGGFDVQFGRLVAGVSACAEYVDIDGADEALCAGGRLGVLVTEDSLIYVPLGWRWQGVDTGGDTEYLSGPYAGIGLETRYTPTVSFKLEYQHTFYQDAGGEEIPDSINVDDNRIVGGINVRLGTSLGKLY